MFFVDSRENWVSSLEVRFFPKLLRVATWVRGALLPAFELKKEERIQRSFPCKLNWEKLDLNTSIYFWGRRSVKREEDIGGSRLVEV